MSGEEANEATVGAVVVATATALAGASGHPTEAVLVAAGAEALRPIVVRSLQWIGDAFGRGARRSGRSIDELLSDLDASAEQQELLIKAAELARSASLEAKRAAIAGALARGVTSPEAAADETAFLRLVEALDLEHVEALRILGEPCPMNRRSALLGPMYFEPDDLGQVNPALRGRGDRILSVLGSHGLAAQHDASSFGPLGGAWYLTGFGRDVLARYGEVPPEDASS